jgi:hypothetical protein
MTMAAFSPPLVPLTSSDEARRAVTLTPFEGKSSPVGPVLVLDVSEGHFVG